MKIVDRILICLWAGTILAEFVFAAMCAAAFFQEQNIDLGLMLLNVVCVLSLFTFTGVLSNWIVIPVCKFVGMLIMRTKAKRV